MNESYYSLGLMSGTSGDGIDASIIKSDGQSQYKPVVDKYFEYDSETTKKINQIKNKIDYHSFKSERSRIKKELDEEINSLEKKITLLHADAANDVLKDFKENLDFIGFHGHTIQHLPHKSYTRQLGDGKLLSKLTKKTVIYNFRQNDMKNGGNGAPLAPIFHQQMIYQIGFDLPITIFNLGGIANVTHLWRDLFYKEKLVCNANDIGPGNCLIDSWIKKNSNHKFDIEGNIAKSGKVDKILLDKEFDTFIQKKNIGRRSLADLPSLDINDFDISFVSGLSLEDGAATLTEYTTKILALYFNTDKFINNENGSDFKKILACGGGRKNNFLIQSLQKKIKQKILNIDEFGINGYFVESQAFAYLAIRSYLKLPISFPETTGCKIPSSGGVIAKNF